MRVYPRGLRAGRLNSFGRRFATITWPPRKKPGKPNVEMAEPSDPDPRGEVPLGRVGEAGALGLRERRGGGGEGGREDPYVPDVMRAQRLSGQDPRGPRSRDDSVSPSREHKAPSAYPSTLCTQKCQDPVP